jgi:hypothetical protein
MSHQDLSAPPGTIQKRAARSLSLDGDDFQVHASICSSIPWSRESPERAAVRNLAAVLRPSNVGEGLKLRDQFRKLLLSWFAFFIFSLPGVASPIPSTGTAPFVLEGNRIYAQLTFVRPDGTPRNVLVFVDLGSPSMILSQALFEELQLAQARSLLFKVGDMPVRLDSSTVTTDTWFPFSLGDHRNVEGLLPAGVLQRYQVIFDYANRRLTLAQPGTLKAEGAVVPLRISEKTGLIVVDVGINGEICPVTVDTGSAYTWLRKITVQKWLEVHPDWQRGIGAVGASNMRMAADGIEARGTLLRIPEAKLGSLRVRQIGALAIGPSDSNWDFIDWYSQKNPVAVIGWIGGNVLRGFRITIDYAKRMSYWLPQSELDVHDLDQVGLTLEARGGEYFVTAIVTQNGEPTVDGVQVGDKLLGIDSLSTANATWGEIFRAMHGKPGELRALQLARTSKQFSVQATIRAF